MVRFPIVFFDLCAVSTDKMKTSRFANESEELCVGILPLLILMALIPLRDERGAHDRARFLDVFQFAQSHRLHEQISHARALDRARDDGSTGRVRRELVHELVFRSAADDVELVDAPAAVAF